MNSTRTMAALALLTLGLLTGCSGTGSNSADRPSAPAADAALAPAPISESGPGGPTPKSPAEQRDIVKTASLSISAGDPATTADAAGKIATAADGRVDSRSEDSGSGGGYARVNLVIRVPAAKLDSTLDELKKLGTVNTVTITSDDVTAQRVDLDARINALQTSVDRLLAIMRDAKDPDALIKAEDALSARQADLDSLRAQRKALGEQIDFSSITMDVSATQVGGPTPQYRGFLGQVHRGWDTLVEVGRHFVFLFGFLLPWLGVLLAIAAVAFGVRAVRQRRAPRSTPVAEEATVDE